MLTSAKNSNIIIAINKKFLGGKMLHTVIRKMLQRNINLFLHKKLFRVAFCPAKV